MAHNLSFRPDPRSTAILGVVGFCLIFIAAFTLGAPRTVAESPTYSREVRADVAAVWKACLSETEDSQGHRIEAGRNPHVLWLFYDFGDMIHPLSELAGYAESADGLGNRYGRAEIKLTVQPIKPGRTQITANGSFQLLSLPTAAAYLPLRSKGTLERKVVDSVTQKVEGR